MNAKVSLAKMSSNIGKLDAEQPIGWAQVFLRNVIVDKRDAAVKGRKI